MSQKLKYRYLKSPKEEIKEFHELLKTCKFKKNNKKQKETEKSNQTNNLSGIFSSVGRMLNASINEFNKKKEE